MIDLPFCLQCHRQTPPGRRGRLVCEECAQEPLHPLRPAQTILEEAADQVVAALVRCERLGELGLPADLIVAVSELQSARRRAAAPPALRLVGPGEPPDPFVPSR